MRIVISLFLSLFIGTFAYSQNTCKVLVQDLQGQYTGGCKKGLAQGEGSARGIDTYTGKFRKGLPHGFGVYSYANGSNYIGNYKKGMKDGYGLLNKRNDAGYTIQHYGLWFADSLVIPNDAKALYIVKLRKGINFIDPSVNRDNAVKDQIWIYFMEDGVPDNSILLEDAIITSGTRVDTKERSLNTLIAFEDITEFPVTIELKYSIKVTDKIYMVDCHAMITLLTPGLWEIKLDH